MKHQRKMQSVFTLDLIERVWSTCACVFSSVFIVDIWTDFILIAGTSSCSSVVCLFWAVCVFAVFSYALLLPAAGLWDGSLSHRDGNREESLKEREGRKRHGSAEEGELGMICR